MHRFSVGFLVLAIATGAIEAITYQCEHFEDELYNQRYCALFGVMIVHDAEDVDFLSEYPRPYRFEFFQSNLTEIPRSLFTTFPEMQSIDFTATGIENINKFTFENAKQLQNLHLSGNRLTLLNNFVFKGCDRLSWLDLSRNQLQELKEKAFYEIPTVATLNLSFNQLVTLPEGLFVTMEKLSFLLLNDNRLVGLSDGLFRGNPLVALDLNHNHIAHISDALLSSTGTLQRLYLVGNALQNITLPSAPKKIDLAQNNLTTILVDEASYEVDWLNLSGNALTNIANVSVLSNLQTLDLSFNCLKSLPLTTFLAMTGLSYLNLEATNLTSFEHGIFSQQFNLTWLDVSFNRLQTFDLTVLTASSKLALLQLDGNNLTSLEYRWTKELFPSLSYLGLFANKWNCSYLIELVRYCKQSAISVTPMKAYGTVLHMTNVQGIYCTSSPNAKLPSVSAVYHSDNNDTLNPGTGNSKSTHADNGSSAVSTDRLYEMVRQLNQTTLQRVLELEGRQAGQAIANVSPSDSACSAMHAYNYQIFILLILSVILIINIGFLLWVQHNANARRAVDQMIIFRREHGASIQTELHGDF